MSGLPRRTSNNTPTTTITTATTTPTTSVRNHFPLQWICFRMSVDTGFDTGLVASSSISETKVVEG